MTNDHPLKRWASFPFRLFWRWTDTVRDRAIRRLDQRLDVALTRHIERLSEGLSKGFSEGVSGLSGLSGQIANIAEVAARRQQELQTELRSIDFCLESVLRELARLQVRLDELAAGEAGDRWAGADQVGQAVSNDQGAETVVLPFAGRRAA